MKSIEERKNIILSLMRDKTYVPMKEKELAIILQVAREDRPYLSEALNELIEEHEISINKRGRYSLFKASYLQGIFSATQYGFGFVSVEGEEGDFYISENNTLNAMHGDTVEIEPIYFSSNVRSRKGDARYERNSEAFKPAGKRREACVVKIVERATNLVVGTFDKAKNHYGFVIPDNRRFNQDIFVPVEKSKGAVDGHKVVVEITDYGSEHKSPEGKIVEILGAVTDPGVDILSVIKAYDIPTEFPERVMNQAERIPEEVSEDDMIGRRDLRDVAMVTIDSEDTKDIDDAVSVHRDGDNYILGVHIADVTNYVQENSALDREALKRGTSVYLCDRVLPMLPRRLSNGICSLNEGVDRLALSCIMTISPTGEIIDHEICESVINSNRKMTYTIVNKIIENEEFMLGDCNTVEADTDAQPDNSLFEIKEEYRELIPMFIDMRNLAAILREKRKKRGSIDFDLPETKIDVDATGRPIDIRPYDRNTATKIIEDFMLAANETIAEHFCWQEVPFVYRTHETPEPDKIRKLSTFIRNFGLSIRVKDDEVHPMEIQKLLYKIEDTDEEALISRLTLRSMQRAKYSTECNGHFGLACRYYCHFTSPIRRYPDLQIHRIIKESLRGKLKDARLAHYEKILPEVAKQSSVRERVADEAEREVDKLKKAQYMEGHIGEIYEGVISGVTNWGLYVELPNTVEGLVHVSKMDGDYYRYDENAYELVGEASGHKYSLGQRIKVCVNSVDLAVRSVDFVLADEYDELQDRSALEDGR